MSKMIFHGRALYYPYLEFHDLNWLKTAALYYDGLDRIVPSGYIPSDQPEVRELNDTCDLIREVQPGQAIEDITPAFLEFVETQLKVEARRSLLTRQLLQDPNETFTIHTGKTGNRLIEGLRTLGFTLLPAENDELIRFDRITGSLYMAFLANHLGTQHHTPVVTDDPAFLPLIHDIQQTDNAADPGLALATLAIKCALPAPAQDIPIDKIVQFRHDYKDQRVRFSKAVNAMTAGMESVTEQQALQDIIHDKHAELLTSANDLSRILTGINITVTDGILGIGAPLALAVPFGPAGVAAGLIIAGGNKVYSAWLDRRKARIGSPAAYLLSLRNLEPSSFIEDLSNGKLIL